MEKESQRNKRQIEKVKVALDAKARELDEERDRNLIKED